MTYTVGYSDPQRDPIIIEQKKADTSTSLLLLGRNYSRFGELMAENLVALLENFASPSAPRNPTTGQLWYDKPNNKLYHYNGLKWIPTNGMYTSDTEPDPTGLHEGDLWLDTDSGDTFVYYDGNWVYIGGPQRATRVSRNQFREDTLGNFHPTLEFIVDDIIVAILSTSGSFTLATAEKDPQGNNLVNSFPTIDNGINLNTAAGFKFRGTATSAEYADLAERYEIDIESPYGTVVDFGGTKEVTPSQKDASIDVVGVVSENPGFVMNSAAGSNKTHPMIALVGRVPCRVVGKVKKGQRLVSSSVPGYARAGTDEETLDYRKVIGRALVDKIDEDTGLIEIAVGMK